MEGYVGEVCLCHLQHVVAVSKENVSAFFVNCHELLFASFEGSESFGFVAFNPACFVEADGFPSALCAVFVEESVLYDFELELSDGAYYLSVVELVYKHLRYTFVHELPYAFVELLLLHGVGVFDVFEHFGAE